MIGLFFLDVFLVECDLLFQFTELCGGSVNWIGDGLVILLELDQSLHEKLFVTGDFSVSLCVRLFGLVLLVLKGDYELVEVAKLLFDMEDASLEEVADLFEVNLFDFVFLLLAELLKELALALELIDGVFVFLYLVLVFPNVLLYPKSHSARWWAHLLPEGPALSGVLVEGCCRYISLVVVLSLDACCVHFCLFLF